MRRVKILYIITLAEIGGAQTHLRHLVRELDKENFEITVACSPEGPLVDYLNSLNIPIIKIPSLKREIDIFSDIKALFHLYRICRKGKYDIVHAHSSKAGFLGRLAAYMARIPVIIFSVHGFSFTAETSPIRQKIYKLLEFIAGLLSKKVICVSSKDMQVAVEDGIISAKRVLQIANGVDVSKFSSEKRKTIREKLGISDEEILLGVVTRLVPGKGVEYLIDAFNQVRMVKKNIKLIIIGGGPLLDNLKAQAKGFGLEQYIIFTGFREDIADQLSAIDIFVFPSLFEAMPYSILEAMAAGKPIIASKVGGIPEVISNGVDGILVNPQNCQQLAEEIIHLADEPELREKLGRNARNKIEEHFSLASTIKKTEKIYRQGLWATREKAKKVLPPLLAISDVILLNFCIVLAFLVRFKGELPPLNFAEYTPYIPVISALFLLIFYLLGLFDVSEKGIYESVTMPRIAWGMTLVILSFIGLRFFQLRAYNFPRAIIPLSWFFSVLFLTFWHKLLSRLFLFPTSFKNIVIAGWDEDARNFCETVKQRPYLGYRIIGYIDDEKKDGSNGDCIPYLGNFQDVSFIIQNYEIDSLVISSSNLFRERFLETLIKNQVIDLEISYIPQLYDIMIGKVEHKLVGDIPLIPVVSPLERVKERRSKRVFDLFLACFLILLTFPFFLFILIAYYLLGIRPIFRKFPRIGKDLKEFTLYRFNILVKNYPENNNIVPGREPVEFISTIGNLLRKLHLDGFPQLINVIKGEMSFIGPQAERPDFVKEYLKTIPGYSLRFNIKPGITGLAQINGTFNTKLSTTLKYDLIYIYKYSFFRDVIILKDFLKKVLSGS